MKSKNEDEEGREDNFKAVPKKCSYLIYELLRGLMGRSPDAIKLSAATPDSLINSLL